MKINLDQYLARERLRLEKFKAFWQTGRGLYAEGCTPNRFPEELTEADWAEQYEIWKQLR